MGDWTMPWWMGAYGTLCALGGFWTGVWIAHLRMKHRGF